MYMRIRLNSKLFIICLLYIVICTVACAEETYTYDARGRRDPFTPLLKPLPPPPKPEPLPKKKKVIESLADIEFIEEVKLQGIACDSAGKKVALLNGEMMKEGEVIGHLTLKQISRNEIILVIDENEHKLSIYKLEEGG